MRPRALIVVDPLNDFFKGGALVVPEAERVIEPIKKILYAVSAKNKEESIGGEWLIICARDWHPENSKHFEKWPIHCVRLTNGAEIYSELRACLGNAIMVYKGVGENEDGYSAFDGFNVTGFLLNEIIDCFGVEENYICGLTTEYCCLFTAIESAKRKYKTFLIKDACCSANEKKGEEAIEEMKSVGVSVITSDELIKTLY